MRVKHKEQIKQKQNRNKHGKVKKKKKEIMFFLLYHYSGLQKKRQNGNRKRRDAGVIWRRELQHISKLIKMRKVDTGHQRKHC